MAQEGNILHSGRRVDPTDIGLAQSFDHEWCFNIDNLITLLTRDRSRI
jgi:hypothetical protein